MASSSLLAFYLLLLCLVFFPLNNARHINPKLQTVAVSALIPPRICNTVEGSGDSVKGRPVLEIVDLHGPCSPFSATGRAPEHDDDGQAFKKALNYDQSRVQWINSMISSSPRQSKIPQDLRQKDAVADLPVYDGDSLGTGNFIVNVGLGTPKRQFNLVMDTGSSLSWVQCEPCFLNFPQFHLRVSISRKQKSGPSRV